MTQPNETPIDTTIGDDGLTAEERGILETPVAHIAPEQRHILCALHEKRSNYIYAENDRLRAEQKTAEEEKRRKEIVADQARHAKIEQEKNNA